MKRLSIVKRLAVSLAALVLSACVPAATTVIPHPQTHRGLAPNLIPQFDHERAAYFGLQSEVFTDEASLVSIDERSICFAVTLRVEGQQPALAQLNNWRVYLRGEPNVVHSAPIFGPPSVPVARPYQASIPRQEFAGYYSNCSRFGCSPTPRYITVRDPAIIQVLTNQGSVCFEHSGTINARTRWISLRIDDPIDPIRRIAFRWQFSM